MKSKDNLDLRLKKVLLIGVLIGVAVGAVSVSFIARKRLQAQEQDYTERLEKLGGEKEEDRGQQDSGDAAGDAGKSEKVSLSGDESWNLILVNETHPLDIAYVPELEEIEPECSVDKRIAEEARQMLSDARAEGLNMYICSAYRSYERQRDVFNSTMEDWIAKEYSPLEAYEETKKSVAVPGTSEHATGLALDIISMEYGELDEKQAETAEAQWLAANCWKYGFILRYPPEKVDVTGIIYEPWHYRYVGKEAAEEIMEQGITLEEYLGE